MNFVAKLNNDFLLRRIHSLTGIIPIGGFMAFHLLVNSVAIQGPEKYNAMINLLRSLPFLEILEIALIYAPIIFHALYGIFIYTTAKPNQWQYSHTENWRYILQRVTGMIGLFYLGYHMFQFRFVHDLDYNYIATEVAGGKLIEFLPQIPLINPISVYWFFMIGVLALCYHLANGLWGFCITWGITVGKRSQQIMSVVAIAAFFSLAFISIETINHLAEAGHKLLAQ